MKNYLIVLMLLAGMVSCKNNSEEIVTTPSRTFLDPHQHDSCNFTEFVYDEFEIQNIPYNQLPYITGLKEVVQRSAYDEDSIPIIKFHNEFRYHPVYIAEYALDLLDVFYTTKDSNYLNEATKNANKLASLGIAEDSSLYLPYDFGFRMHYDYYDSMVPPWYSAMAQGLGITLFCRMYELTGDTSFLQNSHKLFNSLIPLKGNGKKIWFSCVDKNGNLWLEEYPTDVPCFTLNGMIFAIYGLYDYYRITQDELAATMIKASITTIKNNVERFRNDDDITYYCIKHEIKAPEYQPIHIRQMKMLEKISLDPFFGKEAELMERDIDAYNKTMEVKN